MTDKSPSACQTPAQQQAPIQQQSAKQLCLGGIMGAYGVRGEVRIKTFTQDPLAIAAYGVLSSADGKTQFTISKAVPDKMGVRAKLKTITDRTQAEALKGVKLYVPRAALPSLMASEDDFYHADLIGLTATTQDGRILGVVSAIYNFGAGDLLAIGTELIPFTKAHVPQIDIERGRLLVVPPVTEKANRADRADRTDRADRAGINNKADYKSRAL